MLACSLASRLKHMEGRSCHVRFCFRSAQHRAPSMHSRHGSMTNDERKEPGGILRGKQENVTPLWLDSILLNYTNTFQSLPALHGLGINKKSPCPQAEKEEISPLTRKQDKGCYRRFSGAQEPTGGNSQGCLRKNRETKCQDVRGWALKKWVRNINQHLQKCPQTLVNNSALQLINTGLGLHANRKQIRP